MAPSNSPWKQLLLHPSNDVNASIYLHTSLNFLLWELRYYESTYLPPCHQDSVPALRVSLVGSQLLLILLLVGVREARVKMSQCKNVASPTSTPSL